MVTLWQRMLTLPDTLAHAFFINPPYSQPSLSIKSAMTSDLATRWAELFNDCITKGEESGNPLAASAPEADVDANETEPPMKAIAYCASEPDRGYLPTNQGPSSAWVGSAYTTTIL